MMNNRQIFLSIIGVVNITATISLTAVIISEKPTTKAFLQNIATKFSQKIAAKLARPKIFDKKFNTTINDNSFSTLLRPPLFVSGDIYEVQKTIHIKEITLDGNIVDHGTIREIWEQQYAKQKKEDERRMQSRRDPKLMSSEQRLAFLNNREHYRLNEHLDPFIEANNAIFCPKIDTIFVGSQNCGYCYPNGK